MAASAFFRRQKVNFIEFWKRLGEDYMTTVRGVVDEGKAKPWKAVVGGVTAGVLAYAYATCPDEHSMLDDLRERRQMMTLIPTSTHNPTTDAELTLRTSLLNQKKLEHYNMLFFSLLVRRQHDTNIRLYRTQDPNVNSWWITDTLKNIMDVGAFGRWYHLERAFEECDVNTDEFPPEQATTPAN